MLISKFFNFFKKFISIIIIFFVFDVVFFYFLPEDIKSNLYNNRAHRIKSFYYHHDLRPMSSFYDQWGYERYKIYTNNLGFKDKSISTWSIIFDQSKCGIFNASVFRYFRHITTN